MKKIKSKLWNVYVCIPEEMDVVGKKSHRKLEEGSRLTCFHTTENKKPEYYIDGKYFERNIEEAITKLILSNEFINCDDYATEEECDKRATEVAYSLINEVLKNL